MDLKHWSCVLFLTWKLINEIKLKGWLTSVIVSYPLRWQCPIHNGAILNALSDHVWFPQSWVQKTGLTFYLADFHGRNRLIPSFYENKTQHWALFSTKTNHSWFYFQWANLLKSSGRFCSCQSRDTSCRQSRVEDSVLKLGLKNYESKFLNLELRIKPKKYFSNY